MFCTFLINLIVRYEFKIHLKLFYFHLLVLILLLWLLISMMLADSVTAMDEKLLSL